MMYQLAKVALLATPLVHFQCGGDTECWVKDGKGNAVQLTSKNADADILEFVVTSAVCADTANTMTAKTPNGVISESSCGADKASAATFPSAQCEKKAQQCTVNGEATNTLTV